jgi:predicted metal-dependent hydrolase
LFCSAGPGSAGCSAFLSHGVTRWDHQNRHGGRCGKLVANRYGASGDGGEPAGVRVREQQHLWGSCGKDGTICLNWHLAFAPKPVLEYAVVHEMCHLLDRSHDTSFWQPLSRVMPDYVDRKQWLEQNELGCRWG